MFLVSVFYFHQMPGAPLSREAPLPYELNRLFNFPSSATVMLSLHVLKAVNSLGLSITFYDENEIFDGMRAHSEKHA